MTISRIVQTDLPVKDIGSDLIALGALELSSTTVPAEFRQMTSSLKLQARGLLLSSLGGRDKVNDAYCWDFKVM
jgi:hypothetical protein